MYRHLYGLTEKPFQISTDPSFLWLGSKHREALAVLVYGVRDSKGFLLLSGGVGTGKTTLIRSLLSQLDKKVVVATIQDPGLTPIEFFNFLAAAYGMRRRYTNKVDFLFDFAKFLRRTRAAGRRALLIVDEAQRLDQTLLEEIRLLSNIEDPDQKLLNVFFVGQEEFLDTIAAPANRALKQRITVNYHLANLNPEETRQLVCHRLKVAGASRAIFTPDAFPLIHQFSQGAPRLINILCDHALLTGFVKDVDAIGGDIITECIEDLMLPGEQPGHLPAPPPEATGTPRPAAAAVTAGMMLQNRPPPIRRPRWPWAAAAGLLLAVGAVIAIQDAWRPLGAPEVTAPLKPSAAQAPARAEKPLEAAAGGAPAEPGVVEQASTASARPKIAPGETSPTVVAQNRAGNPEREIALSTSRPTRSPDMKSEEAQLPAAAKPPPPTEQIANAPGTDGKEGSPAVFRTSAPAAPEREPPGHRRATTVDLAAVPALLGDNAGDSVTRPANALEGKVRDGLPAPSMVETSARSTVAPPPAAPNDDQARGLPVAAHEEAPAETIAALPAPASDSAKTANARPAVVTTAQADAVQPSPLPSERRSAASAAAPPSPLGLLEKPAPTTSAARPPSAAAEDPRTIPTASSPTASYPTEDRLRDFISAYAQAYESLDLERFRLFFTDDAVENGRPFSTVLPTYRKNFAALAGLEYTIDLMSWERDATTGRITLKGVFNVRYHMPSRDWRTTQGEISMDLVSKEGIYRVKRLEYKKISD